MCAECPTLLSFLVSPDKGFTLIQEFYAANTNYGDEGGSKAAGTQRKCSKKKKKKLKFCFCWAAHKCTINVEGKDTTGLMKIQQKHNSPHKMQCKSGDPNPNVIAKLSHFHLIDCQRSPRHNWLHFISWAYGRHPWDESIRWYLLTVFTV